MTNYDLVADGLCTISEAKDFLKISRSTLYEFLRSGEIPSVKVGRSCRIPRKALHEYAARNMRSGYAGEAP